MSVMLILKQFASFAIVGGVGTAVHFALLAASVQLLNAPPILGSMAGFIAGGVSNYLLNYHLTFRSDGQHLGTSLKFLVIALAGLGLNTLIMYFAIQWLHYLLSQVIATTIVLFWNFLCNRYWTFREASLVKS